MAIIKTPAHLLKPGDHIIPTAPGEPVFVVLSVAHAEPGPVGLQLGRLGPIPAHLDRVATVSWAPMELVDADVPDLTALQLAADDLHRVLVDLNARGMRPADSAEAVDLLQRLTPPTLAEALAVLDRLCNDGAVGPQLNEAERLLHRARVSGVLPRA